MHAEHRQRPARRTPRPPPVPVRAFADELRPTTPTHKRARSPQPISTTSKTVRRTSPPMHTRHKSLTTRHHTPPTALPPTLQSSPILPYRQHHPESHHVPSHPSFSRNSFVPCPPAHDSQKPLSHLSTTKTICPPLRPTTGHHRSARQQYTSRHSQQSSQSTHPLDADDDDWFLNERMSELLMQDGDGVADAVENQEMVVSLVDIGDELGDEAEEYGDQEEDYGDQEEDYGDQEEDYADQEEDYADQEEDYADQEESYGDDAEDWS